MRLALLLVGVIGCAADPTRECTLIGCGASAGATLSSNLDANAIVGATLSVCRNDACASGVLPALPLDNGMFFSLAGALGAAATLWNYPSGIQLDWTIASIVDGAVDDSFTATLTASNGNVLATKTWIASSYIESHPNGEDCAPTCARADLGEQP